MAFTLDRDQIVDDRRRTRGGTGHGDARSTRSPEPTPTSRWTTPTRSRRRGSSLQIGNGSVVRGHKIGLTSRAMQMAMKIDEPDFGALLDYMFIDVR